MGELKMASLKQYFGVLAVGVILVVGLTNCVVTPAPVSSGYVVSPPVVVIQPYRTYQYYYPHRYYRPYHHHRGWQRAAAMAAPQMTLSILQLGVRRRFPLVFIHLSLH